MTSQLLYSKIGISRCVIPRSYRDIKFRLWSQRYLSIVIICTHSKLENKREKCGNISESAVCDYRTRLTLHTYSERKERRKPETSSLFCFLSSKRIDCIRHFWKGHAVKLSKPHDALGNKTLPHLTQWQRRAAFLALESRNLFVGIVYACDVKTTC